MEISRTTGETDIRFVAPEAVGFAIVEDGVEVFPGDDALLCQLSGGHVPAEFAGEDHGEVGVVALDPGLLRAEPDAGQTGEIFAVARHDLLSGLDPLVYITKIAQAHGGVELAHLAVAADVGDRFSGDAEIFQPVQPGLPVRVGAGDASALDAVEDLGGKTFY